MPPKDVFSRDRVLNGAFRLAAKHGGAALTARKVAAGLKCSTMPIYQHFGNIKHLRQEVAALAGQLFLEYSRRPYTDVLFLNMGIGVVTFAREQPALYKMLFMETARHRGPIDQILETLAGDMEHDIRLKDLTLAQRGSLLEKMHVFTHGLASLVCLGLARDPSDEYVRGLLKEVGRVVIGAAIEQARQGATKREYAD